MKLHPRAEAFEHNQKVAICAKEGHIPSSQSWYDRRSWDDGLEPCRRCGEPVQPIIDYSGHP